MAECRVPQMERFSLRPQKKTGNPECVGTDTTLRSDDRKVEEISSFLNEYQDYRVLFGY